MPTLHAFANPARFLKIARPLTPVLFWLGVVLVAIGCWAGLTQTPPDYLQGESVRILYIHVPSAWMSLFVYLFVAANAFVALVWRIRISEILAMAAVPIGAMFTAVTLATGSLWGRPTWGTYWEWDARLTSELVLLFLYFGVLALFHVLQPDGARRNSEWTRARLVGADAAPIQ